MSFYEMSPMGGYNMGGYGMGGYNMGGFPMGGAPLTEAQKRARGLTKAETDRLIAEAFLTDNASTLEEARAYAKAQKPKVRRPKKDEPGYKKPVKGEFATMKSNILKRIQQPVMRDGVMVYPPYKGDFGIKYKENYDRGKEGRAINKENERIFLQKLSDWLASEPIGRGLGLGGNFLDDLGKIATIATPFLL